MQMFGIVACCMLLMAHYLVRPGSQSKIVRGLASAPVIRPRRFWDLHVPYETWDYRARERLTYNMTFEGSVRKLRSWSWVSISISDRNLQEPWSCDWARWRLLDQSPLVEDTLPLRYAISDEPLTPVMFAAAVRGVDDRDVTIFACPTKKTWYLYRPRSKYGDPGYYADEEMWRFHGLFSSVREFIEKADCNRMDEIEPHNSDDRLTVCRPSKRTTMEKFSRHGDGRAAANQPLQNSGFLSGGGSKGTYLHEARDYNHGKACGPSLARALREWPSIPDSELPQPCAADALVETHGPALTAFVPAMDRAATSCSAHQASRERIICGGRKAAHLRTRGSASVFRGVCECGALHPDRRLEQVGTDALLSSEGIDFVTVVSFGGSAPNDLSNKIRPTDLRALDVREAMHDPTL
ncbi:hypothetical protein DFH06DRAFT_1422058 [Mycena polygramma]|nr:hypothetical protein DFH06DRAFT_1422058 [Mycena polygramma]